MNVGRVPVRWTPSAGQNSWCFRGGGQSPLRIPPVSWSSCWLGAVMAEARNLSQVSPKFREGCFSVWLTAVAKNRAPLRHEGHDGVAACQGEEFSRSRTARAAVCLEESPPTSRSRLSTRRMTPSPSVLRPARQHPGAVVFFCVDSDLPITPLCLVMVLVTTKIYR